ncbi:MAG: metallophosphoesterase [Clostridia bacterium]|nr:metallophosphoesterase [Clostridia bacterium]
MKQFKRIFTFILALFLVSGFMSISSFADETQTESSDFVPVIRFVASSDTHVKDIDNMTAERIGKMLNMAYGMAEDDENYKKLDAVLIAGDLTNDGTKTEFDKFSKAVKDSLRGDTKFLGVVAKNHDGYKMSRTELRDYYKKDTGNDADFNVVINGYHFIGLSASPNDIEHYDRTQLKWLNEQLDKATAEDPDRPVFVMHHEHNRDTVYGSSSFDGWGVTYFNDTLKNYPQVVDFSGHSHYPLNDPRSIWQGEYTALGTGAIYYSEFTIDKTRTYHPDDSEQTATCWIVELDAANRMRLRGMDILAEKCLCEYILENPAKTENREYTPEKRKAASTAPEFEKGTEIETTPVPGGFNIKVPAAKSTDGMPVVLYRAKVKNSIGITVADTWTLPKYYIATEQDEIEIDVYGLKKGDYTVTVVAETAYGIDSDALEARVTVTDEGCPYCHEPHEGFAGFFTLIYHYVAYFFAHLFGKM